MKSNEEQILKNDMELMIGKNSNAVSTGTTTTVEVTVVLGRRR